MFSLEKIKFVENSFLLEMKNLFAWLAAAILPFEAVPSVMEKKKYFIIKTESQEIAVMYTSGRSSFYI